MCFFACFSFTCSYAQNAPVSIACAVVSLESVATVPLRATNFNNINSCNLMLSYDPAIASVTGVTIGPLMGGAISTNLTTPGIIILGWYTTGGINLPDSSVMFNIVFSKVGNGLTSISWINDGYTCEFNNGSFITLNDTPTANYYVNGMLVFQSPEAPKTIIPHLTAVSGSTISVPVSVTGFQLIGSFSLNLQYDPAVLTFDSFSNNSGYPDLTIDGSQPGLIIAQALVPASNIAVTLTDSSVLFTLTFNCLNGNTSLNWFDNGSSCQYRGSLPVYPVLNDTPQSIYYQNGSVTVLALPGPAGQISGSPIVCKGTQNISYNVPAIGNATGYNWMVPAGAEIVAGQNTNSILVDYSVNAVSGNISVCGTNLYGNGSLSLLAISVLAWPAAAGQITGLQEICRGQSDVNYSVAPIENATGYSWTIPYNTWITSGANTNSIFVAFGNSAADGDITVAGLNMCGTGNTSEPLSVTIDSAPEIIIQPVTPPTVIAGSGTALFGLFASGSELTFQWQEFITDWNDLNEGEMYIGIATDTLQIINPSVGMNGNKYRCVISGTCDPAILTDGIATLNVLTSVNTDQNGMNLPFLVFPNPFTDFVNVEINLPGKGELTFEMNNLLGETVEFLKESVDKPGNRIIKLNTSSFTQGIYTLSVKFMCGNRLRIGTQKLICKH